MKSHENALNITSELEKDLALKIQYFFMKTYESEWKWKCIESQI
jgi:hypothetical protein